MSWLTFAIAATGTLVTQVGLRTLWALPDAQGVSPNLVLVLAVFVALHATSTAAWWGAIALGVAMDLAWATGPVGPSSLALLAGAYVTVQLRHLVFRDPPLALAALVLVSGLFWAVAVTALGTARMLPMVGSGESWHAADQLLRGGGEALYSAAAALPMGWVLRRTLPMWSFADSGGYGGR